MDDLNFVIVGHVDHGKSTLIGRLLYDTNSLPVDKVEELKSACKALGRELDFSFITDHLQEEREQNVTIDTSQIKFKTASRDYTIIDAPGHKEFLKNMITGASQAEAAVLIVDANEGVKEQTKRHSSILGMLGITQVIVILNKMDLAGFSQQIFESVKSELLAFLKELDIQPAHVIPIVAKDGDNIVNKSERMAWYSGAALLEALDAFKVKESASSKPLRYPIQDVYKIGDKRVLVGRIESGTLKVGQELLFLPSNKKARVSSIEVFEKPDKIEAVAGECIGITISEPLFLERGEIACSEQTASASERLEANVFWLSPKSFNKSEKVTLKLATQEVSCVVERIRSFDSSTLEVIDEDASELKTTEIGQVVLLPDKPVVAESFNDIEELGRFVLERDSDASAGGIVVSK